MKRKWLLCSPYWEACCFLFSKGQWSSMSNFSKEEGFSTWRKLNPRIPYCKTTPSFRAYMKQYLNLVAFDYDNC